jgi:hypothetical protein
MNGMCRIIASTALLIVGLQAVAQAPATPAPTSKPISTSLGMVVFPAKGQAPQKQSQDEGECYAWSKGQTGVDPMAPPPAAAQPAAQPAQKAPAADGSRLRGAARGAAAGAVIGAGGRQSRKNQQAASEQAAQQQQQATQQTQAANQQQLDLFKKGFAACLEPKGYTVK